MDHKKREKLLAIVTGILILTTVVYSSVLKPQINKRAELLSELTQKKIMFTEMQADILIKDRIEDSYARMASQLESDRTDQEEKSIFSQEFQTLNSKFNLKPDFIKFLPMIKNEFYRKILIKVELKGGINNIVEFISNVENEKQTIKFEEISFLTRDRDDNIQLSFVLSKVISNASGNKKNKIQDK